MAFKAGEAQTSSKFLENPTSHLVVLGVLLTI